MEIGVKLMRVRLNGEPLEEVDGFKYPRVASGSLSVITG